MAHIANAKIVIIWEHELQIAAQKLAKVTDKKATPQEFQDALRACYAAIYSPELASGAPVTVMNAKSVLPEIETKE